ncbi:Beta-barrel assembly machine subunit BamA [Alteromonadaceae bacterium Bs31]|nr:Beta-barrel assembly machine subunit BamA [Alteromonadaceae bacterium Bs31]
MNFPNNMQRLLVGLSLLLFAVAGFAQTFQVNDIRLEGLQRVSASPVFAALPVQVGDEVDREDVRGIMRALFDTGFFSGIQVAREGNVLIVILQERPSIKSIEIDGNKAIKTEQLEEVMNDNDLREGEILQRDLLQGITRELERQYVSRARYGASVVANVEDLPNNMVAIKIDVDEGKPARIKHINIVGNKKFSDDELLGRFEITTSKWNSFFTNSDQYAKEKLTGDIETLESYYLDRGYLDFEVLSSQISISPDKTQVFITLNIKEGEVYTVSSIDIAGDPIVPEARARSLVLLREGRTFSQAYMTNTTEYMTTMLGNAGYTNAKVEGIPKKNREDQTVDVTFFIDPGMRVYVRRINFRGNTKTSDEVIRREMRQVEGSSASNARIESSKVRLERLGYFKEVQVETTDVPGTDDMIDVEYVVEEQSSGTIQASVGYAQTTGLNLGVSVQQNNWLGTGKQVQFGINKNTYQTLYSYSYSDPYFTPDGVSRGFSAYYRTRDYEKINVSSYSTDAYGADVRFGYPISEISRVGFGFGFIHQEIRTGEYAPQEIRSSPKIREFTSLGYIDQSTWEALQSNFPDGEYELTTKAITDSQLVPTYPGFIDRYGDNFTSGTLNFNWSQSTLNRGILATRGGRQMAQLETTIPGSEMEYYKLTYNGQIFFPLTKDFTLRLKTRLGYGDGFGEMDELPFFENYFSGGFGSVRGFERSTLGPRGSPAWQYSLTGFPTSWTDVNRDGQQNPGETGPQAYILCQDPTSLSMVSGATRSYCQPGQLTANQISGLTNIGGNILTEFTAEILLPIPFIEDSRSMQLAAFVDAGNVFSGYCRPDDFEQLNCHNVSLDFLSSSAGLGFTWISGFGPMTFSYSVPLHKNENDRTEAFQFSFGTGF